MVQESKGEVFVKLPNQLDLRKDMLEAAKLSTELLKQFDNLNLTLKQKKKEKFKLKLILSEIKSFTDSLNFQDVSYRNQSHTEEEILIKPLKKQKEEKVTKEKKDKLDMDLEEIERRLNSLKF
jgi:hypothetical protein